MEKRFGAHYLTERFYEFMKGKYVQASFMNKEDMPVMIDGSAKFGLGSRFYSCSFYEEKGGIYFKSVVEIEKRSLKREIDKNLEKHSLIGYLKIASDENLGEKEVGFLEDNNYYFISVRSRINSVPVGRREGLSDKLNISVRKAIILPMFDYLLNLK